MNVKKKSLFNFLSAFTISLFIISPLYEYPDRWGYIERHAAPAIARFWRMLEQSPLQIMLDEPLWKTLNAILINFFSPENVVVFIIAMNSFFFIFISLKLCDNFSLNYERKAFFIFLFFTLLIAPQVQHIRQGVAICFFMSTFLLEKKNQNKAVLLTPLIHYGFFMTLYVYYFAELLNSSFLKRMNTYLSSAIYAIFTITPFLIYPIIASRLGTDLYLEAGQYIQHTEVSGLGFILWASILLLFIFQGKGFIKKNMFSFLSIIMYLVAYFTFSTPARLFSNAEPLVIIAALQLSKDKFMAFVFLILAPILWGYFF